MSLSHTPAATTEAERTGAPAPSPAPTPAPTAAPATTPAPTSAPPASRYASPFPTSATDTQSDPPSGKGSFVAEAVHEVPASVDPLLVQILAWPRKDSSFSELQFCKFLREHLRSMIADVPGLVVDVMEHGCLVATVPMPRNAGEALKYSTTLFSCHMDTIEGYEAQPGHWDSALKKWIDAPTPTETGAEVRRKKLTYDPTFGLIALDKDSIGGSLGADDGAGVWLMVKMIAAKVPGTYVFHRGEEVGGVGSRAMRAKQENFLAKFESAIAFDRHDTFEVIHTQGGSRCASDKFTNALCERLNAQGMKYEGSSRGVFTDTKVYRDVIAECVNVAVGYQGQHGRGEVLDYSHLYALMQACIAINWDSLPIDRDPKAVEMGPTYGRGSYHGGTSGFGRAGRQTSMLPEDDDDGWWERYKSSTSGKGAANAPLPGAKKKRGKKRGPGMTSAVDPVLTVSDELSMCSLDDIETWACDNPEDAAKAIGQLLIEIANLKATSDTLMKLIGWVDDK